MKSATQILLGGVLLAAVVMAATPSAWAQQITGTAGSPDAAVTIDGKQIPPPPLPFGGVIKGSVKDCGADATSRPGMVSIAKARLIKRTD